MNSERPVLLVLRHHGLGDLVTAQPALRGLRRHFPHHKLIVTCPSWLLPLARHFDTADQFISEIGRASATAMFDPSNHQAADSAVLANVLAEVPGSDVLVSLRTPGPELLPIIEVTAPRRVVSYFFPPLAMTRDYPKLDFSEHILIRWERLLGSIGIPLLHDDLYVDLVPTTMHQGFTVVHIGAGSPARIWPQDRWVEVLRYLRAKGHRIVLTGSRGEAARVAQCRETAGLGAACDRSGKADIMEVAQLVAGARLVLCGDTGISHLATAFRRPAITLFGPVSPACWGPPTGNPQHRKLWTGRNGDNYTSDVDRGLLEISSDWVINTIEAMHHDEDS
jgi:ADP-heptose:LPS heptosyltransferase